MYIMIHNHTTSVLKRTTSADRNFSIFSEKNFKCKKNLFFSFFTRDLNRGKFVLNYIVLFLRSQDRLKRRRSKSKNKLFQHFQTDTLMEHIACQGHTLFICF